ncbi:LysR family transcriptional regulator [Paenibacillus sp. S33]|uniref:LysR family transcriptional regulator n=1 Tax=Paenibacillus TaxID=44249 RepID=UPI000845F9FA|nr:MULTISPECIES: LysR family transcriptional regulator [Paenibacillus]AOK89706.1 LysR family transcriptional regulator [Paenibacillus polymyxa]KAF6577315.1 LysR family transcriptional regulator [Paenibacillus sp. EKM212P]
MTITQIMIFVRVAETLNFTQTAHELHMTQPAVSHAIASIENELDVQLLLRDRKKGVLLTDIGHKVLLQFRMMLQSMEKVQQQVAAEKGLDVGTITIGAFPSASAYFLPPIIHHIRQHYPNLVFDLHEGSTNEVKEWVHTREIEAGIILLPDPQVDVIPLCQDDMVILLPDGHPLQSHNKIAIRDLNQQDMIFCKGGHEVAIMEGFEREQSQLQAQFITHNISTLVSMVRQGLGMGIVSSLALSTFPHDLTVKETSPLITRQIGIAVPSLHNASLAVQLFVRTAQELFTDSKQ